MTAEEGRASVTWGLVSGVPQIPPRILRRTTPSLAPLDPTLHNFNIIILQRCQRIQVNLGRTKIPISTLLLFAFAPGQTARSLYAVSRVRGLFVQRAGEDQLVRHHLLIFLLNVHLLLLLLLTKLDVAIILLNLPSQFRRIIDKSWIVVLAEMMINSIFEVAEAAVRNPNRRRRIRLLTLRHQNRILYKIGI